MSRFVPIKPMIVMTLRVMFVVVVVVVRTAMMTWYIECVRILLKLFRRRYEAVHILRQLPEGGEGVRQMLTIADEGGSQMLTIADDGRRGGLKTPKFG